LAAASSPNAARTEVGAARIGGWIYVLGGLSQTGMSGQVNGQVRRYDISSNNWAVVAPLPIAVHHPAVTSYNGRLYVHGGFTGNGFNSPTGALQRYNPETNKWKLRTPSSKPRAANALVGMNGKLYSVGGTRPADGVLRSLAIYDIAKGTWTTGPKMSIAREHLTAVGLDGRVFVMGGRAAGQNLDAFERFNASVGGWRTLPDLQVRRSGIASATAHGLIVVFGGEELSEGDTTIEEVESYDRSTGEWSFRPPMLTPRHGLGGASYQGRVFALEGGATPGFAFSNANEYLDIP
jgi:N-acetylneuraminic acid mutarotase